MAATCSICYPGHESRATVMVNAVEIGDEIRDPIAL
jgi:hypothetical protein